MEYIDIIIIKMLPEVIKKPEAAWPLFLGTSIIIIIAFIKWIFMKWIRTDGNNQAGGEKYFWSGIVLLISIMIYPTLQEYWLGTRSTITDDTPMPKPSLNDPEISQVDTIQVPPTPTPLPTAKPLPLCPGENLKPCKEVRMDTGQLDLIKYSNNKELRLADLLSPEWLQFWATVGFKSHELRNQKPKFKLSQDEERDKLFEVLTDWIAGKFDGKMSRSYDPTYGGLIEVSRDIQLHELVRNVDKAISFNGIKLEDRIKLNIIMQMKYIESGGDSSEVRIYDQLTEHWDDLGAMIGYNVGSPNQQKKVFKHFFNKWQQQQGMDKESREKYPFNFEGFRAALKDYGNVRYVADFEEAVACICHF